MPGNRFCFIRIHQPMAARHIGRIADNHVKRSRAKDGPGFLNISCDNADPSFQMVIGHASSGHFRTLLLDLQSGKGFPFRLGRQKDRQDTGTCTHIQHLFSGLHPGKAR